MSAPQSTLTYEGVLEMFRQTAVQIQATAEQMKIQTTETDRIVKATAEQMKETAELMKENALQMKETDRKIQENAEQIEQTNQNVGGLTSSIGGIIENMIGGGNIIAQFQDLGYDITDYYRNRGFLNKKLDIKGEIDLLLEDGDIAILIEVKTTLEEKDVRDHVKRLENFRRYIDARGNDKRRFIGAVAGAVLGKGVVNAAQENGLYLIVQSGKAFEIMPPPEGFVAKKW